ncbi:MAG: transcriptional repressor [Clostridia bacterium]|nr:transcriptional repressor [Clostridia bacterium]
MKHSHKRDAICEVLKAKRDHPTADMICERVREKYPEISLATVYRNLSQLCSDGAIIKIGAAGRERYDIDTSDHTHFFCEACGEVYDIFSPLELYGLANAECEIGGKINFAHITFRGQCKNCIRKENN